MIVSFWAENNYLWHLDKLRFHSSIILLGFTGQMDQEFTESNLYKTRFAHKFKDYYSGKPYADFPAPVRSRPATRSADLKIRNPGLMNVNRKMNLNKYDQNRPSSQAQEIRKHGKNFQKKLQKRFDCQRMNKTTHNSRKVNYERQVMCWYGERTEKLQVFYKEYLKKMQRELGENPCKKQNRQALLNQMNKAWEQEIPQQLKPCFES